MPRARNPVVVRCAPQHETCWRCKARVVKGGPFHVRPAGGVLPVCEMSQRREGIRVFYQIAQTRSPSGNVRRGWVYDWFVLRPIPALLVTPRLLAPLPSARAAPHGYALCICSLQLLGSVYRAVAVRCPGFVPSRTCPAHALPVVYARGGTQGAALTRFAVPLSVQPRGNASSHQRALSSTPARGGTRPGRGVLPSGGVPSRHRGVLLHSVWTSSTMGSSSSSRMARELLHGGGLRVPQRGMLLGAGVFYCHTTPTSH